MRPTAPTVLRLWLWLLRQSPAQLAAWTLCAGGTLLWLMLAVVYPLREQEAEAAIAATVARQARQPGPPPVVRQSETDAGPEGFRAALGELSQVTRILKLLFALADKTGVSIERGDYQLLTDVADGFLIYRATLPLTGPYRAVRSFCEQILLTMPFVSVDQLLLQREHAGEAVLEARLSLSFYLTDPAGGKP